MYNISKCIEQYITCKCGHYNLPAHLIQLHTNIAAQVTLCYRVEIHQILFNIAKDELVAVTSSKSTKYASLAI